MHKKLTPKYHYAGVYMIKNMRNGKLYIGSSANIEDRLNNHRNALKHGTHRCKELQADYNKRHPMTSHVLYVEAVPTCSHIKDEVRKKLYALERRFIQEYDAVENGYNRTATTAYSMFTMPEEEKAPQ